MIPKYPKVRRLGSAETIGILDGPVEVTEKLDGSNARLFVDSLGNLVMGSRNHEEIVNGQEFNGGLGSWAHQHHDKLVDMFGVVHAIVGEPVILVGEFMRKHAINYEINKPYIVFYDVLLQDGSFVHEGMREDVMHELTSHGFAVNEPLAIGEFTYEELADQFMGQPSKLNDSVTAEGIVIKRYDYRNGYGRQCHAKLVNESFEEKKHVKRKQQKTSIDYSVLVEQYVTNARVQKLLNTRDASPDIREMSWLSKLTIEDILAEEILDIMKQVNVLDFKMFNKQVNQRVIRILNELMVQNV